MRDWLTVEDVANIYNIAVSTAYKYLKKAQNIPFRYNSQTGKKEYYRRSVTSCIRRRPCGNPSFKDDPEVQRENALKRWGKA